MFMNISDVNGNFERSDELAVPHAIALPENAGTVNINGQHVASARAQSFAQLQPRNDAYSEAVAERAQASEDGVVGDEVMVEAEQAPAQQPGGEHSQAPSSNSSPSPSVDTSESAGQGEADSETDGARSSILHNGISSATPQQRQLMAAQAAINKERRRRQILPKIAKEDRCGHCHHCLNPKLKKACITAREAQMKKLDDKEELPLFYKMADNKLNSKAVPAVRPKPAPLTQKQLEIKILNEQIQALLTQVDQQVMIKPGKQHHFVDLMHRPMTSWAGRLLFLTSILALPTNDRAVIVSLADRKGLHVLHNWLKTASERPDAEKFQLDVLKTLAVLPVDMAALKKVPVGKTVNTLAKKDPSQKVKAAAAKVVQQWRRNVGMADSDAKRAREADGNVDGAPLKKLKSDPDTSSGAANSGLTKRTSAEGSKLSATGLVTTGSTESVQPAIKAEPSFKAEDASNAVTSALLQNASVAATEEPAGALPMEVDDDAMFQKKSSKPVKSETSENHKVQRLDIAEVARLARDNEQGSCQDSKLKSEDDKPKLDRSSNQTAAPTRARFGSSGPAALGTTRIGAPPSSIIGGSTRIGGLGSIGLGGLGTLSGLNRQTPAVKTAAERAAEAAARIPDPPAGTPRQKPKSVTFVEDGELACVRYFLKTEPAINVRADPDFTASQSSDAAALQQNAEEPSEDHPPEFKSAARQEHMDEAAAIRRQMQDVSAGQDEDELSELLDNMSPTQPWAEPPLNPPLGPEADPIAAGEESTARHEEAQRVQSVEAYPPLHMAPPHQMPQDPLEPAFLEPEPAADYAVAVVQLLTPQEITDLQAAQQLLQKPSAASQLGQAIEYQPHLDSKPSVEQSLVGQMQHEGMQQAAPAPFQASQQGGLIGQYPPAQQPGPPASYPQQQAPGFVGRPPGGSPLFRPPPGSRPAGAAQGLAIMRPLQAHGGLPGQHAVEAPFAEPLPAGREVQLPTNAKPHSAVCKYFHTPKGCGRGATCGFKHIILEPAEGPQAEHRNVDTGTQPHRGLPSAQGRGRGPRDRPLHSSRPGGGHNEGPAWQQSRKCAFFNTPKGCDKGDRCRFAHVREEEWSGSDRGRFSNDRGEHREDWERDRSQQRNDWQAVNRKASGWDQRPDG